MPILLLFLAQMRETALHKAAEKSHIGVVKILVDADALINEKNLVKLGIKRIPLIKYKAENES